MQLESARLCLECDEIHQDNLCPACASRMFVYPTRWIPRRDRSATPPLNVVVAHRAPIAVGLKKSA